MSPTGEQVTLMVISSLPGTEFSGRNSETQAERQPWGCREEGSREPRLLPLAVPEPWLVGCLSSTAVLQDPSPPRATASWHCMSLEAKPHPMATPRAPPTGPAHPQSLQLGSTGVPAVCPQGSPAGCPPADGAAEEGPAALRISPPLRLLPEFPALPQSSQRFLSHLFPLLHPHLPLLSHHTEPSLSVSAEATLPPGGGSQMRAEAASSQGDPCPSLPGRTMGNQIPGPGRVPANLCSLPPIPATALQSTQQSAVPVHPLLGDLGGWVSSKNSQLKTSCS